MNAADERGATALMRAAQLGNEDVLQALLKAGAKVNAVDKKGRTAVMIASDEDKPGAASTATRSGWHRDAAGRGFQFGGSCKLSSTRVRTASV